MPWPETATIWVSDSFLLTTAVFVGYGSHLLADTMTLGGVQLFWPSRLIAVFPGRDEYRVISGSNSERVFVAIVFVLALLFYPVSRVGFDGLIYQMGGADQVYGKVKKVTDGDTVSVEVYGQTQPVRLIGVDTPETVAPGQPVGCYGKKASAYTRKTLTEKLVRLEIPRIGDSEDAYGRTLAYVYLDTDKCLRAPLQRGPRGAGPRPYHNLLPCLPPRVRAGARGSRRARSGPMERMSQNYALLIHP